IERFPRASCNSFDKRLGGRLYGEAPSSADQQTRRRPMSPKRNVVASVSVCLTMLVLVGLVIGLRPVNGQAPAMHGDPHKDMFYTVPQEEQRKVRIIGDDRFKDEPIAVSPKRTENHGTLMIIEGDVIVGKESELLRANLNQLRDEASVLDLTNRDLVKLLPP